MRLISSIRPRGSSCRRWPRRRQWRRLHLGWDAVPTNCAPGTRMTSLTCCRPISASPVPTFAAPASDTMTFRAMASAMPSRGKSLVVKVHPARACGARRWRSLEGKVCLRASTVLISGFWLPARTIMPITDRARLTSLPVTTRFSVTSSSSPPWPGSPHRRRHRSGSDWGSSSVQSQSMPRSSS